MCVIVYVSVVCDDSIQEASSWNFVGRRFLGDGKWWGRIGFLGLVMGTGGIRPRMNNVVIVVGKWVDVYCRCLMGTEAKIDRAGLILIGTLERVISRY